MRHQLAFLSVLLVASATAVAEADVSEDAAPPTVDPEAEAEAQTQSVVAADPQPAGEAPEPAATSEADQGPPPSVVKGASIERLPVYPAARVIGFGREDCADFCGPVVRVTLHGGSAVPRAQLATIWLRDLKLLPALPRDSDEEGYVVFWTIEQYGSIRHFGGVSVPVDQPQRWHTAYHGDQGARDLGDSHVLLSLDPNHDVIVKFEKYSIHTANIGLSLDDAAVTQFGFRVDPAPRRAWTSAYRLQPGHAYRLRVDGQPPDADSVTVRPSTGSVPGMSLLDLSVPLAAGDLRYTGIGHSDGSPQGTGPGPYADSPYFYVKLNAADVLGFEVDSNEARAAKDHLLLGSASLGAGMSWRYFGIEGDFEFGMGGPVEVEQLRASPPGPTPNESKAVPVAMLGLSAGPTLRPFAGRAPVWISVKSALDYFEATLPHGGGTAGEVTVSLGGAVSAAIADVLLVSVEYRRSLLMDHQAISLGIGTAIDMRTTPAALE